MAAKKPTPAPKTATPKTAVARTAAPQLPSEEVMSDEMRKRMLADAADDGMDFGREDLAVPFLRLAQDLTPQTKRHEAVFLEGLRPGDFFHTVSGEIWTNEDGGVCVVPVAFQRSFTEWKPRDEGGGLVKDWGSDDSRMEECTKDEKFHDITPEGTQMVRAALYYVIIVNPEDGTYQQAALSLSGTQLKHARKWNALIGQYRMRGIPGYGKAYRLTSVIERNNQGSWSVVHIEPAENVLALENGEEIYAAGKRYSEMVREGTVVAKQTEADNASGAADDKNVPF